MNQPTLQFTVPNIPPSYTASFKINYGLKQTYLSQEARKFKDMVKIYMPHIDIDKNKLYSMHNEYYYDWYYKNGNVKKKDVQNMNRLLIDAVFRGLGIDDSVLFKVTDEKVQSHKCKTVVKLYVEDDDRYKNEENNK